MLIRLELQLGTMREGDTASPTGLGKISSLKPQACSRLFGFSPEGDIRTAGVRKPPESGELSDALWRRDTLG